MSASYNYIVEEAEAETSLNIARAALQVEIDGMQEMLESLDQSFVDAVDVIDKMKGTRAGRLIVTGMGKSGHIARKMAATFSSTGTPSMFVHPGEASHGDMGMITNDDVVIALSNSGEAPELSDIIAYTRRFSIPLIAMTANPQSALGRHGDICLSVPRAPEACPHGLAPTTSTTMMIAMGDALAVTLLKKMNLTQEQYKVFHPGGKLGQKLMNVSEVMDSFEELPLVHESMLMSDALLVMTEKNLGCLIVLEEGSTNTVKGIVTDGDLKRHMNADLLSKKAGDIMTENPKAIKGDCLAAQAVDVMTTKFAQPITSLLVEDDNGGVCGLIRLQACLKMGIV